MNIRIYISVFKLYILLKKKKEEEIILLKKKNLLVNIYQCNEHEVDFLKQLFG